MYIDNYNDVEKYLNEVPKFSSKNPFEATKGFYTYLQSIDNSKYSENNLGQIIHVAGTNGKGSVCSFMQEIAKSAEKKVGMFISPHLITTRERFCIDGACVSESEFVDAFNWVQKCIDAYRKDEELDKDIFFRHENYVPTYFEILFFMGIYIFINSGIEVCILETGLGGRLDTTNVIEKPSICIITEIGLDHMKYLGNTIEQIAAEKAGIIKPGIPVVTCDRKNAATVVIEKKSTECVSDCYKVSENTYKINEILKKCIDFSVYSGYYDYGRLVVNTEALYQVENAAIAIKAAEVLQYAPKDIIEGVGNMRWAGRMEEISERVYIDGAHNEDGIKAFVETVNNSSVVKAFKNTKDTDSRCVLVFSAVNDKKYDKMIEMVTGIDVITDFVITRIPGERGVDIDELLLQFKKHTGKNIEVFDKISDAYEYALKHRGDNGIVYIVGSLYLAGVVEEIRKGNESI
ncbi:MAG: bifunctional folylpolyglutamate synthase/dihydrofolate synthase [Lachnospiraceae bacterium]|nr:bifunctional folylpolyglutamate synthase/dihydrofolate synthase [Lachnospiraceae bacterium]